MGLKYRHEVKHVISSSDKLILSGRLPLVMQPDSHAKNGAYHIRSLYFDNIDNKALTEKLNGNLSREKFRIRYYDEDLSYINLEKKSKINNLCNKQSALLTKEEVTKIIGDDISWMIDSDKPLVRELYTKMRMQGLKPKTIVDYIREPYIFAPGNVRVTIDYNIRTSASYTDFLNKDVTTIPAGDDVIILEVKWDEFLPDIIKDVVQLGNRQASSFSKYVACRVYE